VRWKATPHGPFPRVISRSGLLQILPEVRERGTWALMRPTRPTPKFCGALRTENQLGTHQHSAPLCIPNPPHDLGIPPCRVCCIFGGGRCASARVTGPRVPQVTTGPRPCQAGRLALSISSHHGPMAPVVVFVCEWHAWFARRLAPLNCSVLHLGGREGGRRFVAVCGEGPHVHSAQPARSRGQRGVTPRWRPGS